MSVTNVLLNLHYVCMWQDVFGVGCSNFVCVVLAWKDGVRLKSRVEVEGQAGWCDAGDWYVWKCAGWLGGV